MESGTLFKFPLEITNNADDVWTLKEVKGKKATYFNPLFDTSKKTVEVTEGMIGAKYSVLE